MSEEHFSIGVVNVVKAFKSRMAYTVLLINNNNFC